MTMLGNMVSLVLMCTGSLILIGSTIANSLPTLNFGGFTWAENLCFDGRGNLFVSESSRGELWRIALCANQTAYCGEVWLTGLSPQGLAASPDGLFLLAAVKLDDKSYAISNVSTTNTGEYSIVSRIKHEPNGLAVDWDLNMLYYTGTADGTMTAINLKTFAQVDCRVSSANGAWLDSQNKLLYIGELFSKTVHIFNVTEGGDCASLGVYSALSELGRGHLLDDITLESTSNPILHSTILYGADYSGKSVRRFSLDGLESSVVAPPPEVEFFEVTSVRRGKGPGFDSGSLYVSEGGGNERNNNRRVIQILI
jgi:sugar lactone lactonase YvrE